MAQSSLADKVVLVTSTMYDLNKASDRTRSVIALESIAEAYRRGYEMIIYDSDSPRHLLQMFSEAGARVIASTSKTMGGKRREAIADALKTEKPVIAYFEPEKTSYVPEIEKTARQGLAPGTPLSHIFSFILSRLIAGTRYFHCFNSKLSS